jgi:NADPH-dependent glutamate synthase beta subunit-like oxidoreductase
MRSNIPSFRLPQAVLDEEIGMILDMGVTLTSSARRWRACRLLGRRL